MEQRAQQSLLLRKLGEDVEWRKWDVQEKRQRGMDVALAQRLSDIHQVIIVHPDEVPGLAMSRNRLCVTLVHRLVSLPKRRLEVTEVL